jgi:hypothetical protein
LTNTFAYEERNYVDYLMAMAMTAVMVMAEKSM